MYSQYLFEYNELMQQMLATNAQYLAISIGAGVSIILFIGGFIFLFSIRPLQNELKETVEKINKLVDSNSRLVDENRRLKEQLAENLSKAKKFINKEINNYVNKFGELEGQIISLTDNFSERQRAEEKN